MLAPPVGHPGLVDLRHEAQALEHCPRRRQVGGPDEHVAVRVPARIRGRVEPARERRPFQQTALDPGCAEPPDHLGRDRVDPEGGGDDLRGGHRRHRALIRHLQNVAREPGFAYSPEIHPVTDDPREV